MIKKNIKDNSFKEVFGNHQLFCEFIKSFINIDILKNIQPEDIEDISERFITILKENRDGDTIKKINLKNNPPLFVIVLLEHQSDVKFLMSFRFIEYLTLIWSDYIKNIDNKSQLQNKNKAEPSKSKDFKLPPIIPIVFYEGDGEWTAEINLKDKVYLSDMFSKYIPSFEYEVVNLNKYTKEDLLNLRNLLSLLLLIDKVKTKKDFYILKDISKEYIEEVTKDASESLILTIANIAKAFLEKVNVPEEEIDEVLNKVYERRFVEMFTMIEHYDVQETRKEAKLEGRLEGKLEGKSEGIMEGRNKEKIEIAKNLLALEVEIDKIQKATGLLKEQILEIKKTLQ